MNWLLIVVVVIIAGDMVWGFRKGFLRTIYTLVEGLLIFAFVMWASPYVETYVIENTQIPQRIQNYCVESMRQNVLNEDANKDWEEDYNEYEDKYHISDHVDPTFTDVGSEEAKEKLRLTMERLGIQLPESLEKAMYESDADAVSEAADKLFSNTGDLANNVLEQSGVYDKLAAQVTIFIIRGLSYLVTFIFALIVFRILGSAFGFVNKIPLIGGVNRTLGIVAGALKGLFSVWFFFGIVAFCAPMAWAQFIISFIYSSPALIILYQNNVLLNIILMILGL